MERQQTYGVLTDFTNFKNEESDIKLVYFTGKIGKYRESKTE